VIGWMARLHERTLREVLRLGEETAVYRVVEAPSFGYDRRTHGAFTDVFDPDAPGSEALAQFRAVRRVSSRVAFVDPSGAVIEDDVTDLAAVVAGARHAGVRKNREPLNLSAGRSLDGDGGIDLLVSSYSDIWLPWCSARFEEGAHLDDLADNRELARRHTPRLNEFLARVGELAERAGGELGINLDDTSPNLAFQLHDHGVLLDADDPRERSVWERFGGRGDRDLLGALRHAAERVAREPPPAPYRAVIGAWTKSVEHVLYEAERSAVLDALRAPGGTSVGLDPDELAGIESVKVQTGRLRHVFDVAELTT